jgi:DNA-binding NtrC family response regulator
MLWGATGSIRNEPGWEDDPVQTETRILIAEDDVAAHDGWREMLSSWGYNVAIASDGEEALDLIRRINPHILLADIKMPRIDGLGLLHNINTLGLRLATIMISGNSDYADAVQAMKLGALDYLRKPIDWSHLHQLLDHLARQATAWEEACAERLRNGSGVRETGPIMARSQPMRRVMDSIRTIADSTASVVISGESGTGKELAARTIHDLSSRRSGPYVGINCAAIPENLLESELFGHERGAFTGADRRHEGCFEQANGGTLMLDEISETRPEIQAKLLRVIEERKLRRVGGSSEISLDVRIIAASNRDLAQAVREGRFREDLYYRLNVLSVAMPPLRERTEDIPLLVNSFVQYFGEGAGKRILGVDDACLGALMAHQWPGNIRQLRNVIERAVIYAKGPFITTVELPPDFQNVAAPGVAPAHFQVRLGSSAEEVERELVLRTLEFASGNKTLAAKILKFSAKTLYNKLARYTK